MAVGKPATPCRLIRLSTGPSGQRYQGAVLKGRSAAPAYRRRSNMQCKTLWLVIWPTEWERTLPPNHHTVMAYTTAKPEYTLRVTIDYEDEAGYQWRRTDISPPKRMGKELE